MSWESGSVDSTHGECHYESPGRNLWGRASYLFEHTLAWEASVIVRVVGVAAAPVYFIAHKSTFSSWESAREGTADGTETDYFSNSFEDKVERVVSRG